MEARGRLIVQGQRRANSFRVLRKTWSFIAARWRDADRPMDAEAWEDLFDPNRFAWRDFQEAFPRPDGLRAEDTRAAFDRAARVAGGAVVVAEAARRYAVRMADRDPHWLKTAGRWLAGGFWRDELESEVAPQTDETLGASVGAEVDASAIGTSAPDLAESWVTVVRSLARRVGAVPVAQWFGEVAIAPGARPGEVRIAAPSRFVRDEIDTARAAFLDEVARCRAAYAADAGETASARACPDAPWRWYLDPDMADLEAALERLPRAEAVRKVLGGPHDR